MEINKKQIEEFVNGVQPEDEMNKMAILGYCNTVLGVRVTFREDNADLPKVSLAQFKEYIHEGMYRRGDIVFDSAHGGTGIVRSTNLRTLSLVAYVDRDGKFHEETVEVERAGCRTATLEEMFRIQRRLHRAGLGWDKRRCVLFRQEYIPRENQQVRLNVLGRKMGLGVFKEIDKNGRIVMYCVKMEGEDARYSLHEVVGKAEDYQINLISTYERNIFTEELKQAGVSWNGHLKQIKAINHRVGKGETYYYLNDVFEIIPTTDNYKAHDTKRLTVGNYFISPEKADRLLKAIVRELGNGPCKAKGGEKTFKKRRNDGRGTRDNENPNV